MNLDDLIKESEQLADKLLSMINVPRYDDSPRTRVSDLSCTLALEHWDATRKLLADALLPSALVVHRAQFEAVLRSVWCLYAATDEQVAKLSATLDPSAEQAAGSLPQVADMMRALTTKAPQPAHSALLRFKENSWKALNSYAHAGLHPLARHESGYPFSLVEGAFRNANGLGVFTGMQAAVLSGRQPLQKQLLELAALHPSCMPPPL